jgi:hypothetical protein
MAFCVSMAICSHLHKSLKKVHSSNSGTFPCVSHLLCWSSSCQCHYPSTPLCLTYQKKRVSPGVQLVRKEAKFMRNTTNHDCIHPFMWGYPHAPFHFPLPATQKSQAGKISCNRLIAMGSPLRKLQSRNYNRCRSDGRDLGFVTLLPCEHVCRRQVPRLASPSYK